MKTIPLKSSKYPGKVAMVSDRDYKVLSKVEWNYTYNTKNGHEYATRWVKLDNGKWQSIGMHRAVLEMMTGNTPKYGDHKNRDGLDNRRSNLRDSTMSQNLMNARKHQGHKTTSQYKGVFFFTAINSWYSTIMVNKKRTILGKFATELDAALAYDEAAKRLCGKFARPNFPDHHIIDGKPYGDLPQSFMDGYLWGGTVDNPGMQNPVENYALKNWHGMLWEKGISNFAQWDESRE